MQHRTIKYDWTYLEYLTFSYQKIRYHLKAKLSYSSEKKLKREKNLIAQTSKQTNHVAGKRDGGFSCTQY